MDDPSFTTMETGLLPEEHGIIHHAGCVTDEEARKANRTTCVAQELRRDGWETIGFDFLGRWHRRGFSHYIGPADNGMECAIARLRKKLNINPGTWIQNIMEKTPLYGFLLDLQNRHLPYRRADEMVDEAIKFLRSGARQYLFLHFWDPHAPYSPPKEFVRSDIKNDRPLEGIRHAIKTPLMRYIFDRMARNKETVGDVINAYDGAIRFSDYHIGRLLAKLDLDRTLVIINADHGESLTENEIYFDHSGDADCVMRIPMMIYSPHPNACRVRERVDLTLIAKTIREAVWSS